MEESFVGTLWHGGTIYTMQEENTAAEAVFVRNGIIEGVGTYEELSAIFASQITNRVDLKGSTMYPGFVDSHMHLIGHGEKLVRLDLSTITSSQNIVEVLTKRALKTKEQEWIIGEGWNENLLLDRKIFHRNELDEIAPTNPMMLTRVCRHAVIVNSMALKLAGITNETEDPPGGVIVRDHDGVATGYLLDQAQELVKKVIPAVTEEYLEKALTVAVDDCLKLGLVGAHSEDLNYYGGFERTYQTFLNVIDGNERKFKVNLLVHHEVVDDMDQLGYRLNRETDYIEFGAMKIFADGALGGRTALLSQPYNDVPETSGVAIHSLDQLKELVQKARKYKMPVAIHTIGDLAFEYALDAIEDYPPIFGQRDRFIHAQILRKDLIDRAKKQPLILDIQPRFVATDFPWVIERIGEVRMNDCYAWKTLLENNLSLAGGSDAPIEPVNPLLGIHAAVSRRHPDDTDNQGYYPNEKLTVFDAVKLFTSGSAFAICKENQRGHIAKGYQADFTIVDRDLFTIETDEILQANVVMTVVDDMIMYQNR